MNSLKDDRECELIDEDDLDTGDIRYCGVGSVLSD
jgi:hypothetical protein